MSPVASLPAVPASFQNIKHIVTLMLENRSFDHLIGLMRTNNPNIVGLKGDESNYADPNNSAEPQTVSKATTFTMPFDPGHEFLDVQRQLFGPQNLPPSASPSAPNAPVDPAPMNGFLSVQSTRHERIRLT